VRLSKLYAKQREKHVVAHARPHLELGEEVISWARAEHPEQRRHGFLYLTTRKLLIVWSGHHGGCRAIGWPEISAWGVDAQASGGPLLGVEATEGRIFVHMPVRNDTGVARVSSFLRKFARLAPTPLRLLRKPGHPGDFESDPSRVEICKQKLSPADLTKRIVVTLIGLLLIFTGAVITPIPGPWSLPIVLGGLAVLASEYEWARDVLEWVKTTSRNAQQRLRARRATR
jgi:hypothetical protein